MPTYDFTPLFRSSVGFDRWSNLFDAASRADDSAAESSLVRAPRAA